MGRTIKGNQNEFFTYVFTTNYTKHIPKCVPTFSGRELEQLNQIAVISGSVGYLEEHV